MSNVPSPDSEAPKPPASPTRLFIWAAAWLLVAVAGFVVMAGSGEAALASNLEGQRTAGIVLITPVVAAVVSVIVLILAIRAIRPARAYRQRWSTEQRAAAERAKFAGQPVGLFFVIGGVLGALWLAGVVAVAIFFPELHENPTGLSLAVMLLALLAMAWVPSILAGIRRADARRS